MAIDPSETHHLSKPPRKQLKWLRRFGGAFVALIALILLAYAFENWRGRRAWDAYVAQSKAAGEALDPAEMVPPPVPDVQNFAMVPLLKPLFEYDVEDEGLTSTVVWRDPKHKESLEGLNKLSEVATSWEIGNWRRGKRTEMKVVAEKLAKQAGNEGVVAAEGDPAQAVLSALGPAEQVMAQIAEAALRPYSRFPIRYEDGLDSSRPHLGPMLNFGKIARLRASARLAAGDVNGAREDVLLGFRLGEKMAGDPVLIGYLVRLSIEEASMIPLWEGLVDHHWNDQQLSGFQQQLAKINHAAAFQQAMRAERQFAFRSSDEIRANPWKHGVRMEAVKEIFPDFSEHPTAVALSVMPRGWFDISKAEVGRLYGQMADAAETSPPRFHPERTEAIEDELAEERSVFQDYGKKLARLTASVPIGIAPRAAAAQSTVDLALIALALERHRLRHGSYPGELAALDPAGIEKTRGIPADPLSGHPPRYRATKDGRFILYYDSWNQQDDGGTTEYNYPKGPKPKIEKGDWVWPQVVEHQM